MLLYRYILIILLQVVILFGVKVYSFWVASSSKISKECEDILNRTLFEMRFCIWNIMHIIVFFVVCVIMKPYTLIDHMLIFAIGIIWYFVEYMSNYQTSGKTELCPDVAYDNILMPRFDDFIYNTLGQVFYVLWSIQLIT